MHLPKSIEVDEFTVETIEVSETTDPNYFRVVENNVLREIETPYFADDYPARVPLNFNADWRS